MSDTAKHRTPDQEKPALTDIPAEVQELTAEDAANVDGGLLPAVKPTELLPAVQTTDTMANKVIPGQFFDGNFQKV